MRSGRRRRDRPPLSGAIFSTRRYVAPDAIGHVHAREPRREDADAAEHDRGRRAASASDDALRRTPTRRRAVSVEVVRHVGSLTASSLAVAVVVVVPAADLRTRLHAVRGDEPRLAGLRERQLDVAV